MKKYNPQQIEKKWQRVWEKNKIFQAKDFSKKPKFYVLIEFPYPSGEGLHVGHCRSFSALDALSRKRRMEGYNVLYPIGWDAFGLPAENYAIKTGIHPSITVKKNIANFKRQMKSLGLSFDWSREINTTDPKYYKWTQWIFLQFFKNGLAYKKKMPINWCPSCKIGLANEEVINGKCERCGAPTEKKEKEQWMLKITKYADRLVKDLDKVNYLEKIKTQQINWIGESYGLEENWQVEKLDLKLKTFTTSPHTSWGATFLVVAPEHPIIDKLVEGTGKEKEAKEFAKKIIQEKIADPINAEKEKKGFFVGRYAINHLNGRRMPIFIANFAIYDYGTGVVKCTPAHDQRDFEFAKKYNLEIIPVIRPLKDLSFSAETMKEAYTGEGIMMNAGQFNGLESQKAKKAIGDYIVQKGNGRWTVNYKLRDWIFSRQHYWGEPIPLVFCDHCRKKLMGSSKPKVRNSQFNKGELINPGWVAVPEEKLPVKLPFVKKYQPTGTGESPLAGIKKWVETKCPKCGGSAKRETDTMPNWAGSSWYFIRYLDPRNDKKIADSKKLKYWMPVDWYNGGMEHTTLHLLYSRFWYKFLYDIKVVPQPEPYAKRTSHGMVLAEDGQKMSKSRGNVVNPDDIVKEYGADTLRVYEMFMGPFDQAISWDTNGVKGVRRFLEKIYKNFQLSIFNFQPNSKTQKNQTQNDRLRKLLHKTIKKVSEDIEMMKFNTAISSMMEFVNEWSKNPNMLAKRDLAEFVKILLPFAPHIAEELWSLAGFKGFCCEQKWPKYDEKLIEEEKINLIIQINGKVRDKIEVNADISEEEAKEIALTSEKVKKWLEGKEIEKIIFVAGKLINIVI